MGIVDLGVLTWLCLEQSHEDVSRHEVLFLEVRLGHEMLTTCCVGASNFSYASTVWNLPYCNKAYSDAKLSRRDLRVGLQKPPRHRRAIALKSLPAQ